MAWSPGDGRFHWPSFGCNAFLLRILLFLLLDACTFRLVAGQPPPKGPPRKPPPLRMEQMRARSPPEPTGRPVIHIAEMTPGYPGEFTPIEYMMKHLDVPNRTLLPDFDIMVQGYPYSLPDADAPVVLTAILGDDTPTYHAITGPQTRVDNLDVIRQTAQSRILHVSTSDGIIISDRSLYPYAFRAARSLEGVQSAIYYICATNEWRGVLSVWSEQDLVDAANHAALRRGITSHAILADIADADWVTEAWQTNFVNIMRDTRIKVAVLNIHPRIGSSLVCRVHTEKLSGMQYFIEARWGPGWHTRPVGSCTSDDMYVAVYGHITLVHVPGAPGVNYMGATLPIVDEDESNKPLSCMPDLTAEDFFNDPEHINLARSVGLSPDPGSTLRYFSLAGVTADAVCISLLALHDAIYQKGVSLTSIAMREPHAFRTVMESMAALEFQSPTGPFRFYNETGDPEFVYLVMTQDAIAGRSNASGEPIGMATFPNGQGEDPNITVWVPIIWRDGSTGLGPKPSVGLYPDCDEVNSVLVWDSCVPCEPGQPFDPLLRACRRCAQGQYQEEAAQSSCETSTPGSYVPDPTNPTGAAPCPRGHECPRSGMVDPQPCAPGRFAKQPGQAACELCAEGTYQMEEGQSECNNCSAVLAGAVTENIASTDSSQCICPTGTFRLLNGDTCVPCLEGMVCLEGSDMRNLGDPVLPFPKSKHGFMTRESEPLTVYKCKEDHQCPGGGPGTCASFRNPASVACGDCVNDAYESGEDCIECGDGPTALPVLIAVVLAVIFIVFATVMINKDVHKTPAASLMIVAVAGLLFTSLQALGVFSAMDVPWEEPVKSVLKLTQILSFDLGLLKITCVVGVNALRSFALRQTVAVLAIPFIWLTLLAKKYAPRVRKPKTRVSVELCNSVGTLYSVFFISIVISAVDPFICFEHPGDSGESVQSAPSLLCFEGGRHSSMIIIGMVAMALVPLPFACLCAYGILVYPQRINSHSNSGFLLAMRFLFFRYSPKRYYYHIFVLLRSLVLCLVPAILRGQPATQVMVICIALSVYVIATEEMQPWRAHLCNPLDASMTLLLILLLLCGALFLEDSPQKDAISALSSVVVIAILICAFAAFSYALRNRLVPRPRYDYFICHHKAHAAAQSRYLKVLLQHKRRNLEVFIDSDNLKELDSLFDIVKSRVKHLVVFLTAETLKRPWCAGEIVTAIRARLHVTRLQSAAFVQPTDEQLASPESYLDTIGCNLHEYHIQWSDITAAFTTFLSSSVPHVDLSENVTGTWRFDEAATALLKMPATGDKIQTFSAVAPGSVLIVTDAESDEAIAAGGILVDLIAQDVYRICEQGVALLCDYQHEDDLPFKVSHTASVAIVIMTPGCLRSLPHLLMMCEIVHVQQSGGALGIISVNTPGFEFPSPTLIASLLVQFPSLNETYDDPGELMKSFFKRISILLPTFASQQALATQAEETFNRIRAHIKGKVGSATAIGGSSSLVMKVLSRQSKPSSSKGGSKPGDEHKSDELNLSVVPGTAEDEPRKDIYYEWTNHNTMWTDQV